MARLRRRPDCQSAAVVPCEAAAILLLSIFPIQTPAKFRGAGVQQLRDGAANGHCRHGGTPNLSLDVRAIPGAGYLAPWYRSRPGTPSFAHRGHAPSDRRGEERQRVERRGRVEWRGRERRTGNALRTCWPPMNAIAGKSPKSSSEETCLTTGLSRRQAAHRWPGRRERHAPNGRVRIAVGDGQADRWPLARRAWSGILCFVHAGYVKWWRG